VQAAAETWQRPDAGLWELEDRWWSHSRLMVVAGLRAWADTPAGRSGARDVRDLAGRITDETSARCTHPSGRWQRAADDERVDAALVVPALRGALPWNDPRSRATLAAVRTELDVQSYVFRYRAGDRPLGQAEGAFLLCSYWVCLAEALAGDRVSAVRRLERALAACGPPGLFSEEYDVTERQLRGNLPQAFVHAMALEVTTRLPGLLDVHP
jgi:GH15 family glucan-1,4-alpha-glucosidase